MKRYIKFLIVPAVILFVVGCLEILNFTHPETAEVGSEVDVAIEVKATVNEYIEDRRGYLIVGMLAPESWNMAENAVVTYSSEDLPSGAITDAPMRLATDEDKGTDGRTWKQLMTAKLENRGNYEPVEWVVFVGMNPLPYKGDDIFTGTVNIKFKAGEENIKTNLSYFIGNTNDGVNDDRQYYLLRDQVFTTTGGEDPLIDYTMPKICTVSPDFFTWEDIVRFNFDATIEVEEGVESELKGADQVYFISRAVYSNGTQEVVVDEISDKTKMVKSSEDKWYIYMYPHDYFSIPANQKIEDIYFYLVNEDRSIELFLPEGGEFNILEKCK